MSPPLNEVTRSRAWVVAIVFAIWALIGVIEIIFVWSAGFDRDFVWFL